jgi:hypothetical protein
MEKEPGRGPPQLARFDPEAVKLFAIGTSVREARERRGLRAARRKSRIARFVIGPAMPSIGPL